MRQENEWAAWRGAMACIQVQKAKRSLREIQGVSNAGCRRGTCGKNRLLKSAGGRSHRTLRTFQEFLLLRAEETFEELTRSALCFREITLVSLGQAKGAESKPEMG